MTNGVDTIIPLETTGQAIFTEYDTNYAIHIQKYGVYKIDYFFNDAFDRDTTFILAAEIDGSKVISGDVKGFGKANEIISVSSSLVFSLTENDEITLIIRTENDSNLIFGDNTNTRLSVMKLD